MSRPAHATPSRRPAWVAVAMAMTVRLLLAGVAPATLAAGPGKAPAQPPLVHGASIGAGMAVGQQARRLAHWVAVTNDHAGAPFIIVDKPAASVLVFDADARLRGRSAVLLGAALGDLSVPGIGTRPMAQILPAERTTPAGRFVAERGRNLQGEDIIWIDYDAAVSMHRVRTSKPAERRAERLATPTPADNRISYGCINVPVAFFEKFVQPIFDRHKAIVYVLPDTRPVHEVFAFTQGR